MYLYGLIGVTVQAKKQVTTPIVDAPAVTPTASDGDDHLESMFSNTSSAVATAPEVK
jgi:hypothetical protein